MRSFSEKNYRNIQSLFTEKTGVPLRKRRAARAAPFALAAAVLAALLTVTALAADLFSPPCVLRTRRSRRTPRA